MDLSIVLIVKMASQVYTHMWTLINLYILNLYSIYYSNYTSIKVLKYSDYMAIVQNFYK